MGDVRLKNPPLILDQQLNLQSAGADDLVATAYVS